MGGLQLEAAWQQGRVGSTPQLLGFVRAAVGQAAYSAVPFVRAAHRSAAALPSAADGLRGWAEIDRQQQALLSGNATAARASTLQGTALLRVAEALLADMPAEDDGAPD
eukprot:COSAG04_NODE_18720_length_434_cov_0.767164_1_plen_108_part_01